MSQEDVILIKNIYLSKQYGARRLLSELPGRGWKLGSIDSLLNRSQLSGNQAAVDRVCREAVTLCSIRTEDKSKRRRSAR